MEEEINKFLQATGIKEGHPTEAERQLPPPPPERPIPEGARVLRLPEPGLLPDKEVNFLEMVEMRASIREYSDKPAGAPAFLHLRHTRCPMMCAFTAPGCPPRAG